MDETPSEDAEVRRIHIEYLNSRVQALGGSSFCFDFESYIDTFYMRRKLKIKAMAKKYKINLKA